MLRLCSLRLIKAFAYVNLVTVDTKKLVRLQRKAVARKFKLANRFFISENNLFKNKAWAKLTKMKSLL